MKKVFISYSHKDSDKAMKLYERLKHARIKLFYDKTSIGWGDEWARELEKGLEESDLFIPCLSPVYLESDWCRKEIDEFVKAHQEEIKGRILPVLFEECPGDLPSPLHESQHADLSTEEAFETQIFVIYRKLGLWPPLQKVNAKSRVPRASLKENFVGRWKEIWAIHDNLQAREAGQCVVTGVGGVGKSQVVVEYALRFNQFYDGGSFWVNADHVPDHGELDVIGQIQQYLMQEQGKVPEVDYQLNWEKQLVDFLDAIRGERPLLIIFDNFPETADLSPYLRLAGSGILTIITTRRRVQQKYAVAVEPMGISEGLEVINSGEYEFGEEAEVLVERLGGLPLALELAKGFLNSTGLSIDEMIGKIDEIGEIESCKQFAEEHIDSLPLHTIDIASTFKLSYDQIISTPERDIIHCLCLMEPLGVPRTFLSEVLKLNHGKPGDDSLAICIGRLFGKWGIIGKDAEKNPIMHRLIRAYIATRLRESPALYQHFSNLVATTLDREIGAALERRGDIDPGTLIKLLSHGEPLCKGDAIGEGLAAHILCGLGRVQEMLGNKAAAVDDLKVAADKAARIQDKILKAKAKSYLGVSLFHQGDFVGSMDELGVAEMTYGELYADGGLDIDDRVAYGTCLDYIGENHREQADYDNASEAHNRAIEVARSTKDPRLRSVEAHAKAQIGAIYLRKKDYDETIKHWKESLAISREIHDAPWVAHFCIDVGFVHLLNGEPEQARKYLIEGTEQARNGGFEDNISRGLMNLGSAHFVSGDLIKAEKEYKEALPIAKENHVVRLVWRIEHNLGNIFRAKGELDKALQHYTSALRLLEKLRDNYGDDIEKKRNFMEHRLRPYQTMIMLALDPGIQSQDEIRLFGDSSKAEEYLGRGMHESLKDFYERALKGVDLEDEREKDKNFFSVGGKGYFVETE